MFFSFKSPLKRKFSAFALHKTQEEHRGEGTFLGASLLNKKPCILPLDIPEIVRISGGSDTYAPDTAIRMIRHAIEKESSVLLVDFLQGEEEFWHRFWAVSFYLDHAKDFRLIDLANPDRSDFLGSHLPKNISETPSHLLQEKKPTDIQNHLLQNGLVALASHPKTEEEKNKNRNILWQFCNHWQECADLLVLFGWNKLEEEKQNQILLKRKESVNPHLILFQNEFGNQEGKENFLQGTQEIMFRQRNSLPDSVYQEVKNKGTQGPISKVLSKVNQKLDALEDPQCLILTPERTDLLQTNTGDGLPWPPDYRPLRSRFE